MIQIVNLEKSFSTQVLFKDVTFSLGKGERIGLVGRNGTGKTTLFKILLGEESADQGDIIIPKNYQIGTLKQHLHFSHETILKECASVLPPESSFDEYKVEKMLMGLGFTISDFSRPPSDFSGGYQIRLNLAKVLLTDPDCLLLDEPTNYLDIVSMRWLAKFLREFRGEVILITHDRGFMDEVSTHIMGIWRQKLIKVKGNSEKYFEQLIAEEEVYEKTRQNIDRKRKDLEDFVNRFKAKASKAAQAQSRMKMLEKMVGLEELASIATLDFSFHYKECPGKVLLELKDLGFGYTDEKIVSNLNLSVSRGDKIAVIGKNGKGKSTLLNLIGKELAPQEGSVHYNPNTLTGHFGQTNITRLDMQKTIEDEITSADPLMSVQKARNIAGTMMFTGELSQKKISVLSGGERARVLLGKILARPTNLLLLDEPTNHLDQDSVNALIDELVDYDGAAIVVTHSEEFLRRYANKLIVFQHGKVEFLPYTYDEFLEKIGWEEEAQDKKNPVKVENKISRADAKRMRSELVVERSRLLSPLKKEMEKLEKKIVQDEEESQTIESRLVNEASSLDGKTISELSQKLGNLKKDVDVNFERLTELTMEYDEKFASYEGRLKELDI